MKKIIFTPAARADVCRIDRDTAMRILTALDRFARAGEGDVKKLQGDERWEIASALQRCFASNA